MSEEINNEETTNKLRIDMVGLKKDVEYIKEGVDDIKFNLEKKYVTKVEFEPIKNLVYGGIKLILVMVIGAIISLII